MDWITAAAGVAGVGGFVTGSISLLVMLREKRRRLTVTLRWGIDPTYEWLPANRPERPRPARPGNLGGAQRLEAAHE